MFSLCFRCIQKWMKTDAQTWYNSLRELYRLCIGFHPFLYATKPMHKRGIIRYANYTVCASVFIHFCMQRKHNEKHS